jgi:hypothetical protein
MIRRFIIKFKDRVIGRGAFSDPTETGAMLQALSAADVVFLSLMIL